MANFDKWGNKFFHPSKVGGYFFQMQDNPKSQMGIVFSNGKFDFPGGGVIQMNPEDTTTFSVGRNVNGFTDSIGGCAMDFMHTEHRTYAYKENDVRDIEYKFWVKVDATDDGEPLNISGPTGHHPSNTENCCQGFAYLITIDVTTNPTTFVFRKEMMHKTYFRSPEGTFTHSAANFSIRGANKYVGLGFCRFNDPQAPNTSVILEVWFNPDPEADVNNWVLVKQIKD